MIGIYMFTNKINNKKYIGQSINIERRYYQHSVNSLNKNNREYSSYFYKAIRKYGFVNFSFEILEECQKEELDSKEKKWIKYYNTNESSKGYNLTEGGKNGGTNKSKKIYQYSLQGELIKTYKNAYEAEKTLGGAFYQSNIQKCASHTPRVKTVGGYIFTYEGDDLSWYKNINCKPVLRISKNGEQKQFHTMREAAKESSTCVSNIRKVINGERKSAGGYFWKEI